MVGVNFYKVGPNRDPVDASEYSAINIQIRDNVFTNWSVAAVSIRNTRNAAVLDNDFGAPVSNSTEDILIDLHYDDGVLINGTVYTTLSSPDS